MKNIFYNPDGDKKVTQRNLPHWQQAGKVYFITFRLADSIPAEKLLKLQKRQQEFAEKVKEIQELKRKLKKAEVESDNLFNGLVQMAFKGEL